MRFLFLLIVALNLALFAFGQGLFGQSPSDEGRSGRPVFERNAQALKLGEPAHEASAAAAPSSDSSRQPT
ncbi:hypothetical protein [Paracandidimonas soli]|uniref:hypothetical protein n=1 Tax=Paracandidimonas soli TaxID=1917182 RepID=UPI001047350F|nr:hypothetical protein [Paracandidimonas soli]